MPFAGEPFAGQPFADSPFAGAPFAGQEVPPAQRILGPLGLFLVLIVPIGGYTQDEVDAIRRFEETGEVPPFGTTEPQEP